MIIANWEGQEVVNNDTKVEKSSADERFKKNKQESAEGVKKITICSDVDVRMFSCNTNDVTAHLYGYATDVDGEVFIKRENDKLRIFTQILNRHGMLASSDKKSHYLEKMEKKPNSKLVLYIQIPEKVFEKISVKSDYGNITMTSFLKANTIKCQSKNGNISVSGIFCNLNIDTKNGNIEIDSKISGDVVMDVISKNGDIDISLENVRMINLSYISNNGSCKNHLKLVNNGYIVSGYINTQNGTIKIK